MYFHKIYTECTPAILSTNESYIFLWNSQVIEKMLTGGS